MTGGPEFGVMEYETPVAPHCPDAGPVMATGTFGTPVATPFDRDGLLLAQLPAAITLTVDPAGITGPNVMVTEVPLPVTTEPAGPDQI